MAPEDVHARDESGLTPLHHASLRGDATRIAELLDAGADVNARTTREYAYVSGILGGAWANSPDLVLPANSTPLDAARAMHEQKKWNTYAWYPSVELLMQRGGTERFRLGLGGWLAIGCGVTLLLLGLAAWGGVVLLRMFLKG